MRKLQHHQHQTKQPTKNYTNFDQYGAFLLMWVYLPYEDRKAPYRRNKKGLTSMKYLETKLHNLKTQMKIVQDNKETLSDVLESIKELRNHIDYINLWNHTKSETDNMILNALRVLESALIYVDGVLGENMDELAGMIEEFTEDVNEDEQ